MNKLKKMTGVYVIEYWLDGRLEVDSMKANSEEEAKQELLYPYKDKARKRIKFVSIKLRYTL